MSNNLFMLMGGALQAIICGILLYIAGRISKLYELMLEKVSKDDCAKDMAKHEREIENLWGVSRKHGERIAGVEKEVGRTGRE